MVKHQKKHIEDRRILKRIINKRVKSGNVQYLAKWKDTPEGTGDWLPASGLVKCQKKIKDFEENVWKYKKRQQIRRRLALIKTLQQKMKYDQRGLNISPLKQKLNLIQISQESQISDSEPEEQNNIKNTANKFQQNTVYSKQKLQVARFDCITGQWKNCYYTLQEIQEINELRNTYAQNYNAKNVVIKNIVKLKDQQVVQYEMGGQKYQCLIKSFKLFMPQLLLSYLLDQYNPTKHNLANPEGDQISSCSSSSERDDDDDEDESMKVQSISS